VLPLDASGRAQPQDPHTFVGSTVAPARRSLQHNRILTGGALATDALKPWKMLLVLHGFGSRGGSSGRGNILLTRVLPHVIEWPSWPMNRFGVRLARYAGSCGSCTLCYPSQPVRGQRTEEKFTLNYTSKENELKAHDLVELSPNVTVGLVREGETFPSSGTPRASNEPVEDCFVCEGAGWVGQPATVLRCEGHCPFTCHVGCIADYLFGGCRRCRQGMFPH
jgi:hypothetical protein